MLDDSRFGPAACTTRSLSTSTPRSPSAVSAVQIATQLGDKIADLVLIAIQDVASALHWLRSTFLFVRITKNGAFYGLGKDTASPEQCLEEICLRAIGQLVQSGIVERQEDTLVANRTFEPHCSKVSSR